MSPHPPPPPQMSPCLLCTAPPGHTSPEPHSWLGLTRHIASVPRLMSHLVTGHSGHRGQWLPPNVAATDQNTPDTLSHPPLTCGHHGSPALSGLTLGIVDDVITTTAPILAILLDARLRGGQLGPCCCGIWRRNQSKVKTN